MGRYIQYHRAHLLHGNLMKLLESYDVAPLVPGEKVEKEIVIDNGSTIMMPEGIRRFLEFKDVFRFAFQIFPTNNRFLKVSEWQWFGKLGNGLRKYGDVMAKFMDENQGCCYWFIILSTKDPHPDPPVFVGQVYPLDEMESDTIDGETLRPGDDQIAGEVTLTNLRWSDFWVEYAREGLEWHKQEGFCYIKGLMKDGVVLESDEDEGVVEDDQEEEEENLESGGDDNLDDDGEER
ncbi:hypothetical protein HDU67_007788 [Dinochytrium kinnereticum]|nr:hypothetical protein HDU67_007788 [Dinochytrium kinnereticum]